MNAHAAYVGHWLDLDLMVERQGQSQREVFYMQQIHAACGRDLTDLLVVL